MKGLLLALALLAPAGEPTVPVTLNNLAFVATRAPLPDGYILIGQIGNTELQCPVLAQRCVFQVPQSLMITGGICARIAGESPSKCLMIAWATVAVSGPPQPPQRQRVVRH
jgi:hypothetical protein